MQAHDDPELRARVRAELLYPTLPSWEDEAVRLWRAGMNWAVIANRCNVRIWQIELVIREAWRAEVA